VTQAIQQDYLSFMIRPSNIYPSLASLQYDEDVVGTDFEKSGHFVEHPAGLILTVA